MKRRETFFIIYELFPVVPDSGLSFRRGGQVAGVYASRKEAEANLSQLASAFAEGSRFFIEEKALEEVP